eukprot:scpid39979/ scgid27738/ Delta-1-pyrroline-5-carboxylate dehydrogenase, mitochondrial; Aldehyde dehydrogenase family 4 member A1
MSVLRRSLHLPRKLSGALCVSRCSSGYPDIPPVQNEPILDFPPNSPEREAVFKEYQRLMSEKPVEIPCIVNGEERKTGDIKHQLSPYDQGITVASFHYADKQTLEDAIKSSLEARHKWDLVPFEHKAAIFLKAADLISSRYRAQVLASTMVGQGKNLFQAEIDSTCELIDFYRFAVEYAKELHTTQPKHHAPGNWNRLVYRGLEGFVAAICPFNFTAIGGNLAGTPALMGNTVLWKPSDNAVLSNYIVFNILREAGLPDGVINFVPADGPLFGDTVTDSPDLAAINFTGSSKTFKHLWRQVGEKIDNYKTFPRLVGECGGKNFHLLHPTADVDSAVHGTIKSTFEYAGQKCSACSRAYIPASLWPEFKEKLLHEQSLLKVGKPTDVENIYSTVINQESVNRITKAVKMAFRDDELTVLAGGRIHDEYDAGDGLIIEPTIIQTSNPTHEYMTKEFFGPILTLYVYDDAKMSWAETLNMVNTTSAYGLTGAVFARDRNAVEEASRGLRQAAGNFYINDKSTGSVVGQQPFGGARASGTNDKAGAASYLLKWTSAQSVKENFLPISRLYHPSMMS